ncbi:MAG: hypothetical protein U0451_03975 [Candidatus Saccharimonadales bacterium]
MIDSKEKIQLKATLNIIENNKKILQDTIKYYEKHLKDLNNLKEENFKQKKKIEKLKLDLLDTDHARKLALLELNNIRKSRAWIFIVRVRRLINKLTLR